MDKIRILGVAALVIALVLLWGCLVPPTIIVVDEWEEKELTWGHEVITVDIPKEYIQVPTLRLGFFQNLTPFFTDDPVATRIAEQLDTGQSTEDKVKTVLKWVNANITYESETIADYWKLPWETVRDGCGDCEDYAILEAAILLKMGVDVILLQSPHHAFIGVCTGDVYEQCTWYDGKCYGHVNTYGSGSIGTEERDVFCVAPAYHNLWYYAEILVYTIVAYILMTCMINRKE